MRVVFALLGLCVLAQTSKHPWSEIVGPSQAKVPPAPPFRVNWRSDLAAAMKEARTQNKPLFVT